MTSRGLTWTRLMLCLLAFGGHAQAQSPALSITSPASGTKVRPGQDIEVTVSVSGGATFQMVALAGEVPIGIVEMREAPPYSFTLTVPSSIDLRTYRLFATGVTSAGDNVDSASILIDAERADTPAHLAADTKVLTLKVGDTTHLLVEAVFADEGRHYVTESTEISYQSQAPQTATVTATGEIHAVGPGVTTITLTYRGLTSQVSVIVLPPLAVDPPAVSLYAGDSRRLYAVFAVPAGTDQSVQWSLSPWMGNIDSEGLYTAPETIGALQTITVTATSVANPSLSSSGVISLFPPVAVVLDPAQATVVSGRSLEVTANVSDFAGAGVTWTSTPEGFGELWPGSKPVPNSPYPIPTATFVAPVVSSATTVTLTATSVYDNRKSATATITVLPQVAAPVFSLPSGRYTSLQIVTITSPAAGAQVRYTFDGTLPSATTGIPYSGALTVDTSVTIRAIAFRAGMADSAVSAASYVIEAAGTRTGTSGYAFRRPITINSGRVVGGNHLNFPVLISGAYPFLASVSNGGSVANLRGYDIVFTADEAGQVLLDHEVESYSGADGSLTAWVRVPELSGSVPTVIYLWYGNAAVTSRQENRSGVWDANYQFVLHLGETAEPFLDSSANGYVSTGGVRPAPTAGRAGAGQSFDGATQHILFGPAQSPNPASEITMQGWVKTTPTNPSRPMGILSKWDNDGAGADHQSFDFVISDDASTQTLGIGWYLKTLNGNPCGVTYGSSSLASGNWRHIVVTGKAGDPGAGLFVDGQRVPVENPCLPHALLGTAAGRLAVGSTNLAHGGHFLQGVLDELRISSVARPAGWIATEYNNQSNPASFYTVGEAGTVQETVTAPAPPSGPASGESGVLYGFSAGGATSSFGHSVQYAFDWGDGSSSGWTPPGVTASYHTWSSPGTYIVTVRARCRTHTEIVSLPSAGTTITMTGESIGAPDAASGPASAVVGVSAAFSTGGASSSLGHNVQYKFYWGDGSTSPWLPAGTLTSSHPYPMAGVYQVTVQARCATHTQVLSTMSAPVTVTITSP